MRQRSLRSFGGNGVLRGILREVQKPPLATKPMTDAFESPGYSGSYFFDAFWDAVAVRDIREGAVGRLERRGFVDRRPRHSEMVYSVDVPAISESSIHHYHFQVNYFTVICVCETFAVK
jgi:hypothetical protein